MTVAQAARLSGIDAVVLRSRIHRNGDRYEQLFCPDKLQGGTPRTPDDICKKIRAEYVKGSHKFGAPALAEKYGLDRHTVLKIVKSPE